jgi:hypothetical protein
MSLTDTIIQLIKPEDANNYRIDKVSSTLWYIGFTQRPNSDENPEYMLFQAANGGDETTIYSYNDKYDQKWIDRASLNYGPLSGFQYTLVDNIVNYENDTVIANLVSIGGRGVQSFELVSHLTEFKIIGTQILIKDASLLVDSTYSIQVKVIDTITDNGVTTYDITDTVSWTLQRSSLSSIKLNGVDAEITLGEPPELNIQRVNPFTVSWWFKKTATVSGGFLTKHDIGGTSHWAIGYETDNSVRGWFIGGGRGITFYAANPTPTQWTHCVVTYNAVNFNATDFKIYFNGVDTAITVTRDDLLTEDFQSSGKDVKIGTFDVYSNWHLSAYIDEMSVFDVAATQSQVDELYNSGTPSYITGTTLSANAKNVVALR